MEERWITVVLGFLTVSILSRQHALASPNVHRGEGSKTILVFGGNGFIGAATVEKLVRRNDSVVIVNRGNWYWDSETRIKPYVTVLKCDRMQSLQKCVALQQYLWRVDAPAYFDAVVDFSAYHAFEITEAMQLLQNKISRYIYISSDSVYEVCEKNHTGPTREEDAVRPRDPVSRETFKRRDDYGNRKLEGEEELERLYRYKDQGVPYISLRLPDVIGPRDNTYRWWIYQLWVKLHSYLDRPVSVPEQFWNIPLSFVYVDDVADVILDCIDGDDDLYNQAYNLAMDETPTLVEFLHSLMDELDMDDIPITRDVSQEAFRLFPSVTSGPIDVTKAKRVLKWNPTSWIDVLSSTVMFYEKAMVLDLFSKPRNDIIRIIQEQFSKDSNDLHVGLNKLYGLTYPGFRDEL